MSSSTRVARIGRGLLSAAVIASLLGCSDSTGPGNYFGTYVMEQFKGQKLPAGDGTIYIRSAELTLRSDGRFQLEMDRDFCVAEECRLDPVSHEGPYSVTGIYLTLILEDGKRLEGRILLDYITLQDGSPGSVWAHRN